MSVFEGSKLASVQRTVGRLPHWVQWIAVRGVSVGLLVFLWWLLAQFYPPTLVPGPQLVYERSAEIVQSGAFYPHFYSTFYRVLLSFAVGLGLSTAVGVLMGTNRVLEMFFETYLLVGLTIPSLAIAMISLMVFGLGETAAIVAIIVTITPLMTENMWEGAKSIDPELTRMARVFDTGRFRLLSDVILPQLVPYLLAATRFGLSLSWKIVVIVEMLGLGNGIGYKINEAFSLFNIVDVLAWTLTFTIVMLVLEFGVIKAAERHLTRWRVADDASRRRR